MHRTVAGATARCLWMQAGVVRRRFCQRNFQCGGCRFDRALRRAAGAVMGEEGQGRRHPMVTTWEERMRERPLRLRPCIHYMRGRIAFRGCTHDYRCSRCEFDQFFDDSLNVHTLLQPVAYLQVGGFQLPHGYYLHGGHAWVRIEAQETVRVGLDDFALRMLGPPDRILAPLVGKPLVRGGDGFRLLRHGCEAVVRSPISGVVTASNPSLWSSSFPEAGFAPYTDGWVLQVQARNLRRDLKHLHIGPQAVRFLSAEAERLLALVEEVQPLAADGGFLGSDIFGALPRLGWDRLVTTFLRGRSAEQHGGP